MSDLRSICKQAHRDGRKLLSIYLTTGFPEPAWSEALAEAAFEGGADLIELGMPYSDPLADGPTIQYAGTCALNAGVKLDDLFELADRLRNRGCVLFMGYLNPILQRGIDSFLESVAKAGMQGIIIPDLPPDELENLWTAAHARQLPIIPFVSPTSPPERIQMIDAMDAPFVYAVSVTGVTGARSSVPKQITNYLGSLHEQMQSPVLAGFGISSPETAKQIAQYADGVIVGSAVIERIRAATSLSKAVEDVHRFTAEIRGAIDEG